MQAPKPWSKIVSQSVHCTDTLPLPSNVKAIQRITETELTQGRGKKSWHDMYAGSAYVFIGT